MRRVLSSAARGLAGVLVLSLAAAASAAKDDLVLVSRASGAGTAGGTGNSLDPSISADGRYIAFYSQADNMTTVDDNSVFNVFVRDVDANSTKFVSRATGVTGAAANSGSLVPSISADGRFVAFQSLATNLSTADGAFDDIFIRNVETDVTALVSRTNDPNNPAADGHSSFPSVSADGRFIAFESEADNLSTADDNSVQNIFVRDRAGGTTTLVSRADGSGDPGANGNSGKPSVSADGRFVAFESHADNLSTVDNNGVPNVFVRDVLAGTTRLVSRASGTTGVAGTADSTGASISADGRFVAFTSFAANLDPAVTCVCTHVYARDLTTNTTTLVSRADGAAGTAADDVALDPAISVDGRYVAFNSTATNLSGADDDAPSVPDIFVRDRVANTTAFVSRASGPEGPGGDAGSHQPSISADGRYVAFATEADNFSDLDFDDFANVYVRDVLGPSVSGGSGGGGRGEGAGGGAQVSDRTSPSLSGLGLSPRAFAPLGGRRSSIVSRRAPQGARVGYRLSETARVSFRVERRLRGRRQGRRCVVTKRKRGRRCTTYKRLRGGFSHAGSAGRNGFRFSGQLGDRRLRPGSYRLVGEPKDIAGNRGRTVRANFRIVKASGARARRR